MVRLTYSEQLVRLGLGNTLDEYQHLLGSKRDSFNGIVPRLCQFLTILRSNPMLLHRTSSSARVKGEEEGGMKNIGRTHDEDGDGHGLGYA
jgi:hypothetical protein